MAITTKTESGLAVTLTGEEHIEQAVVRVELDHPTLGRIEFHSQHYGTRQGRHGIVGYAKGQNMLVTVTRAEFDAAMNEARQIGEREIAALKSGELKIRVRYHDGEYLSGYIATAALLVELGVAESVSGWGTHVKNELVAALGEEFTYAQAAEFARPALEKKQAARDAASSARAEKFAEAARTGKPVELRRWMDECSERDFDCDMDIVSELAMPDGRTKIERSHCH
jgi:hypothetical protein